MPCCRAAAARPPKCRRRDHARNRAGLVPTDAHDAGVGMGRAQHLQVQHPLNGHIHGVACFAGQDGVGEGVWQAGTARLAGDIGLDVALVVQGVVDGTIAGAAAEITFQRVGQVVLVGLERVGGHRHHHAGRAVAALEGLCVVERLLHRVELPVLGQALDGRHFAPFGAKGGHQAGMEWLAVQPHRAGAAIAGVAAFLDAKDLQVAQKGAQALAGLRLGRVEVAVDLVSAHASSARICSAK